MTVSVTRMYHLARDPPIERNKIFYFAEDPMSIFLVENQLFKVHRHHLIQASEVFRDMFSVPGNEGTQVEGMSDEYPISLPGFTVKEFELLLKHFYRDETPQQVAHTEDGYQPTEDELQQQQEENLALLAVAHRFAFNSVLRRVAPQLTPAKIPIPQRIHLGDKYNLDEWLFSAYEELLDRKGSFNVDELEALGCIRITQLIEAREFMLQERFEREGSGRGRTFGFGPGSRNFPQRTAQVARMYFTD